jgi:hypothetical protein
VSEWPATGSWVVVWSERSPSRSSREPHEATVDHVAGNWRAGFVVDDVYSTAPWRVRFLEVRGDAEARSLGISVIAERIHGPIR